MYYTIIDSMCKDKLVNHAFDLYFEMTTKRISSDVVTYSTLISGFCIVDRLKEAVDLFNKMISEKIHHDIYTFIIIIIILLIF
jgi:pentatricopeptide repeat protein